MRSNKDIHRNRLERDTTLYFASLSREATEEENELAALLAACVRNLDFDVLED